MLRYIQCWTPHQNHRITSNYTNGCVQQVFLSKGLTKYRTAEKVKARRKEGTSSKIYP